MKIEKYTLCNMLLLALAAYCIIAMVIEGPIAQDLTYHNFTDQAALWGIPNFANVISNLGFLAAGLWGLGQSRKNLACNDYKTAYLIYCLGVVLTAFGSSWYHLFPSNGTLVWDRLPMTVSFMSLFSLIIRDFVHEKLGRKILIPGLLLGAASIAYWHLSEQMGAGDLRPYFLVQFLPLMLFPVILICYKPQYGHRLYFVLALLFYLLAKAAESFDSDLYQALGPGFSGHTIKHILAAIGSYYALKIFLKARI